MTAGRAEKMASREKRQLNQARKHAATDNTGINTNSSCQHMQEANVSVVARCLLAYRPSALA
jgi:hypothetical protein